MRSLRRQTAPLMLATALAAFAPPPAPAAPVPLRPRFEPGRAFRQTFVMRHVQTPVPPNAENAPAAPAAGPDADRSLSIEVEASASGRTAAAPEPGRVLILLTYERLRFASKTPVRDFRHDTAGGNPPDDPEARPMRDALDRIVGKTLELTVDPDGKVLAVKAPPGLPGAEGLAGKLLDNPLGGIPGALPETPAEPGGRWNHAMPLEFPVAKGKVYLTLRADSEFAALEGDGDRRAALIRTTLTMEPRTSPPSPPAPSAGGGGGPPPSPPAGNAPESPFDIDGKGSATTRFSLRDGWAEKTEGALDMVLRPRPGKLLPGPREVRIRQEFTIQIAPVAADAR